MKKAYEAIIEEEVSYAISRWSVKLWKRKLPLKIKCFLWLCFESTILSCDKRGFVGPGRCVLCHMEEESVNHLFCQCSFCRGIWMDLKSKLKHEDDRESPNFRDCFLNWLQRKVKFKNLPLITIWEVWKARTNCIFFKDKKSPLLIM